MFSQGTGGVYESTSTLKAALRETTKPCVSSSIFPPQAYGVRNVGRNVYNLTHATL